MSTAHPKRLWVSLLVATPRVHMLAMAKEPFDLVLLDGRLFLKSRSPS